MSNKRVNLLFLDEVFGTLSDNRIQAVLDSVVTVVAENPEVGVKLISHEDIDGRLADHVWETKMENGISSLDIRS